jgi:membrane protein DedA with SNARE-associated domain
LEAIIETYGYLAVLIGTFLEGETILVMGGFAAHQGYMHLPRVIAAAFVGTLFGDQLYFYLGRRHSQALLARRPHWKERVARAHGLVERYQYPLLLGFRFLYGLRAVIPFVIGMSRIPTGLFVLLNIVGALVWAILIGTSGYLFGHAVEAVITDIKHYELEVFGLLGIVGLFLWFLHIRGRKKAGLG